MSWGAQNRSKDAQTPSGLRGRSENPELDRNLMDRFLEMPRGGARNDLCNLLLDLKVVITFEMRTCQMRR